MSEFVWPPPGIDWYYSDESACIAHGDCREILPELPQVDLLLTDPPYGIGRDGMTVSTSSHGGRKSYPYLGWDSEVPMEAIRLAMNMTGVHVIWGANYFPSILKPSMGWLIWDKGQDISSSDAELAYTNQDRALRRIVINRVALQKDGAVHPTQKPLALMKWCISQVGNDSETILDPFCGSGSILRAAKDMGRKAIGIELEERYCEIAVERLRQKTLF